MNRLRGWWRIALGSLALLAIPALVEAHTLTGSGGWLDELVCLVPALLMVAAVLVLGRDTPGRRKATDGAAETDDPPGDKTGDLI